MKRLSLVKIINIIAFCAGMILGIMWSLGMFDHHEGYPPETPVVTFSGEGWEC